MMAGENLPDSIPPRPDDSVSLPQSIVRELRPVAAALDMQSPDESLTLPTVDPRATLSAMAGKVGMILQNTGLFRHPSFGLVTVDERTGEMDMMTPERFCSWVEDHLAFVRWGKSGPEAESIGKDLATKLLAADRLRGFIRELRGVHPVRMPAWCGEGDSRRVVLAPAGYDPATGFLTLDGVPYQDDMPENEGFYFIMDTLRYFQWETEGQNNFACRRSFAAMLAAMLGIYCHGLFPPGTARPMIVFNGNQPGCGKSLLARIALCPVHGWVPEGGRPDTESELEKVLDSAAMARKPFLLLDDVANLKSQALNRFATSPAHECRRMHSQALVTAPKVTQVFLTGNGLTITEDLERRAVIVDLFDSGKSIARTFPKGKQLTNEQLANDSMRARFLAALWSLVRNWHARGMPSGNGRKPSFEEWARVIGGIVAAAAPTLADPFGERKTLAGGDEATRSLELVLAQLVGGYAVADEPRLTPKEILEAAESADLVESITSFAKDPLKSLGWKLKKIRGRVYTDSKGRAFEFGKRDIGTGAAYPITFIDMGNGGA